MTDVVHDERPRHRRVFNVPNLVAFIGGVGSFFILASRWNTNLGGLIAALIAGAVAAFIWLGWIWLFRTSKVDGALTDPPLGYIPTGTDVPTPTLTAPNSSSAHAYRAAAEKLEAVTNGHVLLVSGASPGHGASTVALNMAISATQAGRRVVLVDGDLSGDGLARFGHWGNTPGLTDLARGNADLAAASRMWSLSPDAALPFIPPGSPGPDDAERLRGGAVAGVVDLISEHADLMLIDVPPLDWNGSSASLAAHADGSVLVIADGGDPAAVAEARERLFQVGAPVVAHVINRAGIERTHPTPRWRRMIKRGLTTALVSLALFAAWNAYQVWDSWASVGRDSLDITAAGSILPLPPGGIVPDVVVDGDIPEETLTAVSAPPQAEETFSKSFLIVGSDKGGNRADVVILVLIGQGDAPIMVSLPRDLYLPNRCTQGYSRINATYFGCGGEVNGPTLLALTVEDFTGIPIDHFALFDFDGFEAVIDEVGGVEICVEYPVRDRKSFLDLPAGCTIASGEQALAWVRSRSTQQLKDGVWQTVPGVNDLTRNTHQQEVILEMFSKLQNFETPADLSRIIRSVSEAFTLDDQLGLGDAISLAWSLRGLKPEDVISIEIPVENHRTAEGALVLLPKKSFNDLLSEAFPELASPAAAAPASS